MERYNQVARRIVVYVLVWWLAILFFMLVRNVGIEEMPGIVRTHPMLPINILLLSLAGGVALGIPYAWVSFLFDSPQMKRRPYWLIVVGRLSAQTVLTLFGALAIIWLGTSVLRIAEVETLVRVRTVLESHSFLVLLLTSMLVNFAINFYLLMQALVGRHVLLNLLLGRYHTPREEDRIFMFLDLQGSTTHAERLGNVRYSSMVQDCFADLNETLLRHGAELYQYVGDEAVLTWPMAEGSQDARCLWAYFHYRDTLEAHADAYRARYGVVPHFKAGMSSGIVTAAEVGIARREIAYHGDVLNTAARIQARCNEYGQDLMIAQQLREVLGDAPGLTFEVMGDLTLRGKSESVAVYAVECCDRDPARPPALQAEAG